MIDEIAKKDYHRIFLLTTPSMAKRGLLQPILEKFNQMKVEVTVYDDVQPDPLYSTVDRAAVKARHKNCQAILAMGGGSVMDAAKVVSLAITNEKSAADLIGFRKAKVKPIPVFSIPTTAGTGSEVTIASVVSNDKDHQKGFVIDSRTVSKMTALDGSLMQSVPPELTAATGVDALTHALEAYVGNMATKETDALAISAIQKIFNHLLAAYLNGQDLEARQALSQASFEAGMCITRASVGYVHAMSHQLGAHYGVPHGMGNAILLTRIMRFSEPKIRTKLASLAHHLDLAVPGDSETTLAQRFIYALENLMSELNIPKQVSVLRDEDIPAMAKAACAEAQWNYPVPKFMSVKTCGSIFKEFLAEVEPSKRAA